MINQFDNTLELLETKIEELNTYINSLKKDMVPKCLLTLHSEYENKIKKLKKR